MRKYFDIIKSSANFKQTPPPQVKDGWRFFRKIYFLVWGFLILANLLWATVDLLHLWSINLFSSQPLIVSNQDLTKEGRVAATQTIQPSSPPPTELASPPQEPLIDKSSISIQILNGSGKKGEASRLKKELEAKGFTVKSIGTARKIYPTTLIYYKNSEEEAKIIQSALSDLQSQIQKSPLAGAYDVWVVIGKK